MLRQAILICCVVSSVVSAQSPPQIDAKSQPAVNALAAIAQTIKDCPRALGSEKKWGKGPAEIDRWYVGPPQNVVWDVTHRTSVRSAYVGYVEFSLPYEHWVPDEVKDKYRDRFGLDFLLLSQGPVKHRYEFDLGPGGLELTRMLYGNKADADESPNETCWQKAARSVRAMPKQATPGQATSDDAHQKAQSPFSDSGKEFLDQCEGASERVTDKAAVTSAACHAWLVGITDGIQVTEIFAGRDVVCVPQNLNYEQVMRVVIKYLKDHPDQLDLPAAALVLRALRQAFPCEEK